MKKVLTTILILVYFTVSTGFAVSLHYCMDKLYSAHLGDKVDKVCDRCGMVTDGNCCRDEVKVVKLQLQHTIAKLITADHSPTIAIIDRPYFFLASNINKGARPVYNVDRPPPDEQAIYIRNRVFRC
jgi:hypothetical protein